MTEYAFSSHSVATITITIGPSVLYYKSKLCKYLEQEFDVSKLLVIDVNVDIYFPNTFCKYIALKSSVFVFSLSFKRLLTSNSNKFIPFDCAQANWRHNDLHIECVFMHRKYENVFVFSFFYTKVMYQDRNVHEIPKRKTYFFEVLLKCICSAAFMPRCLLFQTFDANRSWISKRSLCCFFVCVCAHSFAVFVSCFVLFIFVLLTSTIFCGKEKQIYSPSQCRFIFR